MPTSSMIAMQKDNQRIWSGGLTNISGPPNARPKLYFPRVTMCLHWLTLRIKIKNVAQIKDFDIHYCAKFILGSEDLLGASISCIRRERLACRAIKPHHCQRGNPPRSHSDSALAMPTSRTLNAGSV